MTPHPRSLSLLPLLLLLVTSAGWATGEAPPTIGSVTVKPNAIEVNRPTEVRVTAVIQDPRLIPGSVKLQRRNTSGRWVTLGKLHSDGSNGDDRDDKPSDGLFSLLTIFDEQETGNIHLRVSAKFKNPGKEKHLKRKRVVRVVSEFNLPVGVRLAPGTGATVDGPNGTNITIEPNSIDYEVLLGIAPVPSSDIVAPLGSLPLVEAVEVIFEPTSEAPATEAELPPPRLPLQISVPAPPGVQGGTQFIVAQQAFIDSISDPAPGLRQQLIPVDTALVVGGDIVTETEIFSGILGSGLFAIVEASGSGFATGTVSEDTVPRPGVVVSNNTNTLVSVTNDQGVYTLFISGGPFMVTGFNPFTGSMGSANGNIAVDGSTVTADIQLTPLTTPPITRDGIRNGGFERCDLSSWATNGAATSSQQLGPTSTGEVIRPTEGQCMADINTGTGAAGETGSSLTQRFVVPAGVRTLRLDFNFVSEEFPEFVGSIFDDSFQALITTPNGQTTIGQVSVNQSGGFTLIGDCLFPGGDETCGQTGWREASVDLSAFAGTNMMVTVTLLFSAVDAGDVIFDTHVLVDNIRFGTVFVDAKIINGANADQARIQREIQQVMLGANDILSQAGLNVRLRNIQTVNDPGGLLDIDDNFVIGPACSDGRTNGRLTNEETQLMGLARSATATDLNVYYVRSLGSGSRGFAVGPDDFCVDVNILTNSGAIMPDSAFPETLAHEMGHILISPDTAGSTLEHSVADVTNFMNVPRQMPRTVLSRQQSANVSRVGAPLVVP